MLSLLVPLRDLTGQSIGKGPILIASKNLADGSHQRIILLPSRQVARERQKAAQPFPREAGAPPAPDDPPPLYLFGDVAAIGDAQILKSIVADETPPHPLALLLRQDSPATAAALAFHPDAVKVWVAPLDFLEHCNLGTLYFDAGKSDLSIVAVVPMPASDAVERAKSVTTAVRKFIKDATDATADAGKPINYAALATAEAAAGLRLWSEPAAADGTPESLWARLRLAPDALPALLANFITFPTPRSALDANVLARQAGCRTLILATLAPEFRRTGADSFKSSDPDKPETQGRFSIDTASEGPDRAEYRLRLRDPASDRDSNDWQVNIARTPSGWLIDWAGPYVPKTK